MKIAYIYLNKPDRKTANANQVLNMLQSLGKIFEVFFLSEYISKNKFEKILSFYSIKKTFKLKRIPIKLIDRNLFFEKTTRFIYCLFTFIYLKFNKFDIIYTRDISFLLFHSYIPSSLKLNKKIIFEVHTIYHKTSSKVSFEQEKRALQEANFFIPISNGIKNDLIKHFLIKKLNIKVLPDGVNIDNFNKIRKSLNFIKKRYNISEKNKIIIYVGSFKKWKGVDLLAKSAKLLPRNIKIILIGGEEEDKDRIEKLLYREKVYDKVIIKGWINQKEIIRTLKSSNIGIIPNDRTIIGERYTSPLKIFEYMACGLPIIAANLPSIREVLIDRKNCLFFEPENLKDLINKIKKMLLSHNLRKKISENNFKKSKQYSWDNRANSVLELIKKYVY